MKIAREKARTAHIYFSTMTFVAMVRGSTAEGGPVATRRGGQARARWRRRVRLPSLN